MGMPELRWAGRGGAVLGKSIGGGDVRTAGGRAGNGAEPDAFGFWGGGERRGEEEREEEEEGVSGAEVRGVCRRGAESGAVEGVDGRVRNRATGAGQYVRDHGDDGACDVPAFEGRGCGTRRESDRKRAGGFTAVCNGGRAAAGAAGDGGRVVCGRGGAGAGACERGGTDGGEVCAGWVQWPGRGAVVLHGRPSEVERERRAGVSGTAGPAGEVERLSD